MGMFDYVSLRMPCKKCGKPILVWQTKDSDCSMTTVDVAQISNFYASCEHCGAWNEYIRKKRPRRESKMAHVARCFEYVDDN